MTVKFATPEWAQALTDALNADEGFPKTIQGVNLTLAYKVTNGPGGEVDYTLKVADGAAGVTLGATEGADVTITSDYETAVALQSGEINPQSAFLTGKIKVSGNLALLMMHQSVLSGFAQVAQQIDVEH